jgi:tRNA threonylcarbamoyl adenosine modification protein (Sua5/YciO/YrdC/YwlC family)
LFAAKVRPPDKAIMVLVDELGQVDHLVAIVPAARILASAFWPGGLTLVLPLVSGAALPAALTAGTATLGIRVPNHATPRALARTIGPLPATSANRSGAPDARDAADVLEQVGDSIDLVLDGGPTREAAASTVIDCSVDLPQVLRAGVIPVERVAAALDSAGLPHALRAG